MEKRELARGWIMQLNPETTKNQMFAGCFMVVSEPKPWGAQGYVPMTGENGKPGGLAYYRATWEEMEPVGVAEWVAQDE
jgi:hypothetical protein